MNSVIKSLALAILASGFVTSALAADKDWGNVTGRFVLKGDQPEPVFVFKKGAPAIRDGEVCAVNDFLKHDLVVDPKTKGIANIFIYMKKKPSKVHPDLKEIKEDSSVTFDQKGCRFKPRCLLVRTGQTVKVLSGDPIAHNTHTLPLRNNGQNVLIGPKDRVGVELDKMKLSESLPFEVKCDFHAWMKAYFLVLDHPYAAITQADGSFQIKGLPPGKHSFYVWHERAGYINRKFQVTIKGGETFDAGAVDVEPGVFEE